MNFQNLGKPHFWSSLFNQSNLSFAFLILFPRIETVIQNSSKQSQPFLSAQPTNFKNQLPKSNTSSSLFNNPKIMNSCPTYFQKFQPTKNSPNKLDLSTKFHGKLSRTITFTYTHLWLVNLSKPSKITLRKHTEKLPKWSLQSWNKINKNRN